MGIFRRRKPAAVADKSWWYPVYEDYEVVTGDEANMGDDSQVMQSAYRVDYQLTSQPLARVVFWTYAVDADLESNPGPYAVGVRVRLQVGGDLDDPGRNPSWFADGYSEDPEPLDYGSLESVAAGARELAETLATGQPDITAAFAGFLEWDGVPFEGAS